jgi:nucleoside-diphosphate-sugar epimerase
MYNNFIIFGSTGGTGIHIVKKLLEQGKNVTIVVRDKTKAKTIFKENYEKIKLVIEEQMGRGTSIKNDELKNALKSTDCLISAIGSSMSSNPKLDEYVAVKELIELAEEAKVKKFALITSLYITRPYTFVSFLLNNLLPFVLGWKSLAENKLRLSKLNYMIIRPGGLVDKEENSSKFFLIYFFIERICRNFPG